MTAQSDTLCAGKLNNKDVTFEVNPHRKKKTELCWSHMHWSWVNKQNKTLDTRMPEICSIKATTWTNWTVFLHAGSNGVGERKAFTTYYGLVSFRLTVLVAFPQEPNSQCMCGVWNINLVGCLKEPTLKYTLNVAETTTLMVSSSGHYPEESVGKRKHVTFRELVICLSA